MGESLDVWREFFRTTDTDIFEFIHKAITIAALDHPKDFLSRRGRIAERLYSCETTRAGGDCALASKESKANGNAGNVAHDVVSMNCSHGGDEAFSDDAEEAAEVVAEVLRIKRVLDNSRHESESALHESLKRLRSMTMTVDILEKTKIGITVNGLRKSCGSKQIAQLAHDITMGWKAMVKEICRRTVDVADPDRVKDRTTSSAKNQNIREPRQEHYDINKAGSPAKRRRLNGNQHEGIVKPNVSSNPNSRVAPASEITSCKIEKERMLQSQDTNGPVAGCKRPLANRQDMIKRWNEVVADIKLAATKRKLQQLYQKADMDKRQRTLQVLDPRDLPKMAASRKAPCATTAKARRRRVISQSRASCV